MNDLKGLRVVVAGAGAVGSVLALVLARRGASVTLADPAPAGANASGVAAGMLAPLGETLFDPKSAGHFALLKAGRDAWPLLLEGLDDAPVVDRSGALILPADPTAAEAIQARARVLGADLAPAEGGFLFTREDWRLEPRAMLTALHQALQAAGGIRIVSRVSGLEDGWAQLLGGESAAADVLVLATGLGDGLTPIKGQILRFPGLGPGAGPVLRGHGVYAAPGADGLIVGATMEEGVADLVIDADAVASLRAAGARLIPAVAEAPFEAFAGVRAATPDGLPVVGPAAEGKGVYVARGARRNGWLLAPLMAEAIVEHLTGGSLSPAADAFDPARFR